jgi:DNA-binding FadR family transcriptional regulator
MKPRGADAVVINIASEIITRRFPAGGFVPTEQVLGERCEVSRMVVREALAAWPASA